MTNAVEYVVLDTETTGWSPNKGDRVIEVAAAIFDPITGELGDKFHEYVNPGFPVEEQAIAVHGITNEFLADKPPFSAIASRFADFVRGKVVVIHHAPFDVGFLNAEMAIAGQESFDSLPVFVICTRRTARFVCKPWQSAKLDALCDLYGIDRSIRTLHGAMVDISLTAQVYPHVAAAKIKKDAEFAALLPFAPGTQLPQDTDSLGMGSVLLSEYIDRIKAEQKRIEAAITPLLKGESYESRDFTAGFPDKVETDWKKIAKAHLGGVNLSGFQSKSTKMTIRRVKGQKLELSASQETALAALMPFQLGSELPLDIEALGRGHAVLAQLESQFDSEKERIRDALKPLLGEVNYSHPYFTLTFSGQTNTKWDQVSEQHLKGVDLAPFQKRKPELSIKAA